MLINLINNKVKNQKLITEYKEMLQYLPQPTGSTDCFLVAEYHLPGYTQSMQGTSAPRLT